jgi:hypothetical protein
MKLQTESVRSSAEPCEGHGKWVLLLLLAAAMSPAANAQDQQKFEIPKQDVIPGQPPSAMSRENLARKRPAPPFNLTGNWMFSPAMNRGNGVFQYLPLPKLKPAAQASYDASRAAVADGKAYKNDEGECFPAGMPESMTRVWPNQTFQLPTMIFMMQMLKHEPRWIYLDGRPHADPEIKPPSYAGDSIGHFEGDTLIVETINFTPKRHWVQPGIPAGPQLKIVERIKLKDNGNILEDTFIMTDPDNWEGEWINTKVWFRYESADIEEAYCLPDLNDKLLSTRPESNVR